MRRRLRRRVEVEFAVDEALVKLDRLDALIRTGDRLAVPALDEALVRLDCVWSDFFRNPGEPRKCSTNCSM